MSFCENCGSQLPEGAAFCPNCGRPVMGATRPRPELAGWGERFAAWIIDIIVVGIFLSPIKTFFFWAGWPGFLSLPIFPSWMPFVALGLDNVVFFLYWTVMEALYGQSIGKMALRLRVTGLSGEPPDMKQATIESLGKAFLLPIDCIVGWILYPDKNQRLFNYLSETVTVRIPR